MFRTRLSLIGRMPSTRAARPIVVLGSLAVLASLVAGGCTSGDGARASSTGVATRGATDSEIAVDPWADLGYRLNWRGFPVLTGNRGASRTDVFDIGILVHDTQDTVTLMDHDTGRNLWVAQVGRPTTRFVGAGVYEDSVLVCSDNEIYFLDAQTGAILDRQSIAEVVNTPPLVMRDTAVFGSATGEVVGHSLYSGYKAWGYLLGGSMQSPPVAVGPIVGAASESGDVLFVDPETGASTGRASIFGGLDNRPVSDGRTMYVASVDQSVYAFAGDTGRRVWRYRSESPITAQPAVALGALIVMIPGEGLVALDALTGDRMWANPALSGEVIGSNDDELLFWDGAALHALSADTGEVLASVPVAGARRVFCSPTEDGDLYVVTADAVAKFSPR